jgi:hypothetical protein
MHDARSCESSVLPHVHCSLALRGFEGGPFDFRVP